MQTCDMGKLTSRNIRPSTFLKNKIKNMAVPRNLHLAFRLIVVTNELLQVNM